MRYGVVFLGVVFAAAMALPAGAQQERPWWASFDLGAGQLKLSSDQLAGNHFTTFAAGITGGHRITDWSRAGLHLNGWLMQAFNLNDPTVGESVSSVNGIVDIFPVRKKPLFVRGGGGWSTYTNNRPAGTSGGGPGWEAGGGYEFRFLWNARLVPTVQYAAGGLGSGFAPIVPGMGLRYSVIEFKLSILAQFGASRR